MDGALLTADSYFEERPQTDLRPENTCIIGLGTGLLAAAAVASSHTLASLLSLAVEVVRIAFRTGVLVNEVSQQLQETDSNEESWSMLVSGVSVAVVTKELDAFHEAKVAI